MNFDQSLIERILKKDEFAFAEFYQATVDDFFRYLISHYTLTDTEAQDIISDVYLKIREWLDKYDSKYLFWQFVRTILKNHSKDFFKKQKPLLFSQLEKEQEDYSSHHLYEEENEYWELFHFSIDNALIQKALYALDKDVQEIIHARFVLWYSYEILSQMFSISETSLRQQISRTLKKLKSLLWHVRT